MREETYVIRLDSFERHLMVEALEHLPQRSYPR